MTLIQKHHFRTYARIAQLLRPKSLKEYSKILLESSKEEKVNKVKGTLILLMYTVMKALRLHESPAFLTELKASCVTVDAYEFLQSNFREPTKEEHTKIMQKIIRIGECLHKKYENCPDKIEEYIGFHFPEVGYHLNSCFEPLQKILFLDLKNELPDWKKYGMLDLYDSILLNQFSNIDYEKQISNYSTLTNGEKSKLKAKCHREYKKADLFIQAMDKFLTYPDIQAFRDQNASFLSYLENAMINFKNHFNESVKKVFHIGDELAAPFFSFGERSSVLSAFCCMINANILVFYESCPEFFSEKNSNFFINLKHAMKTTNFFGAAYDCYVYYNVIRNFLQDLWKNEFTSLEVLRPRYEELIDNLKYMEDNTYFKALVMLHKDEKCDVIAQMSIKNSYINGMKKLTMNGKIFHAFNTFMLMRIKVLLATEWQACDEIISVLQKVAAESKQFEDSYKDLEYTAVTIDNLTGDLHELFKVCSKSLQMNKPDDIVTVIEIRRKAECMNGFKKFIPEIATCLQNYSTKNLEQEYFTKNICTVVRTMKYAELHGFEMVNAKICAMNNLYNSIQDEFIRALQRHITFAVEVYLNESAYVFVTKKILNKMHTWERKNNYKCVYESTELKEIASEFWQAQCNDFGKFAIEKIYNSIVSNEKEFCENLFDEVSEKVIIGQTDNVYNYFDIRSAIQKLYGNGYIYILKNGISIGLKNANERFLWYNNYNFTDVYDDYREWLNRIQFIKDIIPYLNKPEELVEEYRLHKGTNCLALLEYIQNILIVKIPEYNYSSNLFKASEHDIRRVRIIVNEGITPRSLPLLMTILKNCLQILECKDTQHIFINLSRSIDLSWILNESNEIGFKKGDTTLGIQSKEFRILKGDILTKKKGIIEACRSNVAIKTDESLQSTVDGISQPCKIIYEITNKENADCDHKTPKVIFQVEEYAENRSFFKSFLALPERKKTIKITLKLKSITHKIYIQTFMAENDIKIKQTSMKNQKYEYSTNPEFYYYHEKDDPEFVGLSAKQLPNLYTYLQTIRTLDDTNAIPKFSGYNSMVCTVDKFSLLLSCETPNELNALVSTILDNSRDAILDYYALKIHDHIVSIEFQLSEFLTRRINIDHWTAITRQFLPKCYMTTETLSNLIQEFLHDQNELDVINEQDLAGLKTCDYKIGIYAIVRENRNTLIFMMMKECKTDFAYSPMSKVNDIYFNLLRDQEYYKKSHPLNMSNLVLPTHPISYMYKAFFDPNSNLLNILDMDLKYNDNKDTYEELSNKIACYIHEDVMKESSNENGLNIVKANNLPTTATLQEALKYEVFLMIEKIKLCRQRINSSAKVKIQVSSLKGFDGDDIEEINELKALLLQSQ